MNARRKGTPNEHRSRRLLEILETAGYALTRAARRKLTPEAAV